jgi:hypothetical protein
MAALMCSTPAPPSSPDLSPASPGTYKVWNLGSHQLLVHNTLTTSGWAARQSVANCPQAAAARCFHFTVFQLFLFRFS